MPDPEPLRTFAEAVKARKPAGGNAEAAYRTVTILAPRQHRHPRGAQNQIRSGQGGHRRRRGGQPAGQSTHARSLASVLNAQPQRKEHLCPPQNRMSPRWSNKCRRPTGTSRSSRNWTSSRRCQTHPTNPNPSWARWAPPASSPGQILAWRSESFREILAGGRGEHFRVVGIGARTK